MERNAVLFGAGMIGERILQILGNERVAYFVDNNSQKEGTDIDGIPIYLYAHKKGELLNYQVIITVSENYEREVANQLEADGITQVSFPRDILNSIISKKLKQRVDYVAVYHNAISWVMNNTIKDEGIICYSGKRKSYPEVTGYYIPTLIRWGYRDLAIQYAKYLLHIQKENGSWYDTDDSSPYVFDSAQILKGLLAVREFYPEVDAAIIRGCDWILTNVQESGRLTTPDKTCWGTGRVCSEMVHLYCLSPLVEAGKIFGIEKYNETAQKVLAYYKTYHREEIMNFEYISHFYAYVMEALLDMDQTDMAIEAMKKISYLQDQDGMVPAYFDVHWVCSTGLFQMAVVWFRLGEIGRGRKAFEYACKLQNKSGGWFGSYPTEQSADEVNDYFPYEEISWAGKYFLDALYYFNVAKYSVTTEEFRNRTLNDEGRDQLIHDTCD